MSKPLKIDDDGKLAVSEAEVQQSCIQFAATYGYFWLKTNASDLTRAGRPSYRIGTLDGLLVTPHHVIIVEWKRRLAKTKAARIAAQAEAEAIWVVRGFSAIRMREADKDPIEWFKKRFTEIVFGRTHP